MTFQASADLRWWGEESVLSGGRLSLTVQGMSQNRPVAYDAIAWRDPQKLTFTHLKPDRGRAAVRVQAFDAGEFVDDIERLSNRRLVETDNAGATLELVGAETGK